MLLIYSSCTVLLKVHILMSHNKSFFLQFYKKKIYILVVYALFYIFVNSPLTLFMNMVTMVLLGFITYIMLY